MANYKTGAQRYNDRMDKIFAESTRLNEKYHGKDSFGSQDGRSQAMKNVIKEKMKRAKNEIDQAWGFKNKPSKKLEVKSGDKEEKIKINKK